MEFGEHSRGRLFHGMAALEQHFYQWGPPPSKRQTPSRRPDGRLAGAGGHALAELAHPIARDMPIPRDAHPPHAPALPSSAPMPGLDASW
jgi:hypothetical protein